MKTAGVREIRIALSELSTKEISNLCIRLSSFKKENKELLTYLLFEAEDEDHFVAEVISETDLLFTQLNKKSTYHTVKSIRKILRFVKKNIRYSRNKETEATLLIHFCTKLKGCRLFAKKNTVLKSMFEREMASVAKKINSLHEDLQYDFGIELEKVRNF